MNHPFTIIEINNTSNQIMTVRAQQSIPDFSSQRYSSVSVWGTDLDLSSTE